jgi:hypothetical protein
LKDEDMKVGDDSYKGKSAGKVGTASTYRKNGSTGYCFWGNTGQFSAAYPVDPGTNDASGGQGQKVEAGTCEIIERNSVTTIENK